MIGGGVGSTKKKGDICRHFKKISSKSGLGAVAREYLQENPNLSLWTLGKSLGISVMSETQLFGLDHSMLSRAGCCNNQIIIGVNLVFFLPSEINILTHFCDIYIVQIYP